MIKWEKIGRIFHGDGEVTITYASDSGRFTIESRKRNVPHAGRSGSWSHTSYFLLWDGVELAEKGTLRGAKLLADRTVESPMVCPFDLGPCVKDRGCDGCNRQPLSVDKVNGREAPRPVDWDPDYEGRGMGWPKCPACGEYPYSTECCFWCGQVFEQDDKLKAYNEPTPEEHHDCPACGAKGALTGTRSQSNDHFHGHCTECGATVFE